MGKLLSSGTIVVDGERIRYFYCQGERLPNSSGWNNYIEADYGGTISIDDHGNGEKYAVLILENEIMNRKEKKAKV